MREKRRDILVFGLPYTEEQVEWFFDLDKKLRRKMQLPIESVVEEIKRNMEATTTEVKELYLFYNKENSYGFLKKTELEYIESL